MQSRALDFTPVYVPHIIQHLSIRHKYAFCSMRIKGKLTQDIEIRYTRGNMQGLLMCAELVLKRFMSGLEWVTGHC